MYSAIYKDKHDRQGREVDDPTLVPTKIATSKVYIKV